MLPLSTFCVQADFDDIGMNAILLKDKILTHIFNFILFSFEI